MRKQVTVYKTSADFVYAELRSKIISKQFEPGTRLPEIKVAAQLKVSRTPVREALRRLAAEGLVKIIANRGAKVTQPTAEEIHGAYEVRRQLESMSVRGAAQNGLDKKSVSKITQIISHEKRAYIKKDTEALLDMNIAFHKAIAEAGGNPILIEFVESIILRTNVYALFFGSFYEENPGYCPRQHEEILRAVAAKDADSAESLMENHLRHAHSMLTIKEPPASKKSGPGRQRKTSAKRD